MQPSKYSRDAACVVEDLQKIATPEGVQSLEAVEIGGVRQWLSIRGLHRDNPVALFIHGGPGSPAMPTSWAFQKPWEDFFTVVQWDQRGSGLNWTHTDPEALAPTIRHGRLVEDAIQVVDYLRGRLGKSKIVVMGWSHGSLLGLDVIRRRPEWVSVYVGLGQIWPGPGSEEYIYGQVLRIAKARGDRAALAELEAVRPYPNAAVKNDVEHIGIVRKWVRAFNGGWYGKPDLDLYYHLQDLAPECRGQTAETLEASTMWFIHRLMDNDGSFLLGDAHFKVPDVLAVPVIIMMGRYDLQTPYAKARQYFDAVQAPHKRFITFDRAGHFPMLEQPGKFLEALIDEVLPLTEGCAEFQELPDVPN